MDIKNKLKSFMADIKESKIQEVEFTPLLTDSPAVAKFKEHLGVNIYDPSQERDTLDAIEKVYYSGDDDTHFDPSLHELQKLPEELDRREIDVYRKKLLTQLQVVSKKVSEMVLDNHPAYVEELKRVMYLQNQLQTANEYCYESRRNLSITKEIFTNASLKLLANYRKRRQLRNLLQSLYTVKTLQRTDARLKELLEEESYSKAIQLSLECQRMTLNYRQFTCISELNTKLQDTLELIEETLSSAISRHCVSFHSEHYTKVIKAYQLLGRYQTSIDQLLMHFTSTIHNKAFSIVSGFVQLCSNDDNYLKYPYSDLPQYLTSELFTPCLIDLCKALWEIIKNYYLTIQWHKDNDYNNEDIDDSDVDYVHQKLIHGLNRIWADAQIKVKTFILASNISLFKYDEFIRVTAIVNRLIQIGDEFCNSDSQQLHDCIHQQSTSYFNEYHKQKMEELQMFCEHEAWQIWPVHSNFNILYLSEFKFMRKQPTASKDFSEYFVGRQSHFFDDLASDWTPFELCDVVEETEDLLEDKMTVSECKTIDSDSDSEVCEELKRDFIDEGDLSSPFRDVHKSLMTASEIDTLKDCPTLTNTSLTILRIFGNYIQMMTVLESVSFNVITSLTQLYDYYLFTVFTFFIKTPQSKEPVFLSSKMVSTLNRISDSLQGSTSPATMPPEASPQIDLVNPKPMKTLPPRVAAIESLIFLSDTLKYLKSHLELYIPKDKIAFLQQFYSQTVIITEELRYPIYRPISVEAINHGSMKEKMVVTNWSINDLKSMHSPYVDDIIKEYISLQKNLDSVSRHTYLNDDVRYIILEQCIQETNSCFVDGFSSAKKCTSEGRALMQLDYQQFLMNIERITSIKPIPGLLHVESYIKAYYLPEEQLIEWFNSDKFYSSKQVINLIGIIPHLTRKVKSSLVAYIENKTE